MSPRRVNAFGSVVAPGAKVTLVLTFTGNESFTVGSGLPSFGCQGKPCCCYQCSISSFTNAWVYELTTIGTGGCGCTFMFDKTEMAGEPTQMWFDPFPERIELFCGHGEPNPCTDTPWTCPECPGGTIDAGAKIKVHWRIFPSIPVNIVPFCTKINDPCCDICVSVACTPQTMICGTHAKAPHTTLMPPCQGSCGGGEASSDLVACIQLCGGGGGCWKLLGTLSAFWFMTSTGTECVTTDEPCEKCLPA